MQGFRFGIDWEVTPPKAVRCDQCGRTCEVQAVSWSEDAEHREFCCLIHCPACGERSVTTPQSSAADSS